MNRRFILLAIVAAVALLATCATGVSAQSEASQYRDCDACVENGWGWSWSKNQCGGFLNTNCDRESAESEGVEEEDDEVDTSSEQPESNEPIPIPEPAPLPSEPLPWANTEETTRLWQLCHAGDLQNMAQWLYRVPTAVHLRSEDGRGPLFWAYEYKQFPLVEFLLERGADPEALDVNEQKPIDLLPPGTKIPNKRDEL